MPNKCLHRIHLQIFDPKKNLSQPKMNESFEIKMCQRKQRHKKKIKTHTCTPKKTHKIVFKCARIKEQIFGKL
jgi:uncharacterized membrane protein